MWLRSVIPATYAEHLSGCAVVGATWCIALARNGSTPMDEPPERLFRFRIHGDPYLSFLDTEDASRSPGKSGPKPSRQTAAYRPPTRVGCSSVVRARRPRSQGIPPLLAAEVQLLRTGTSARPCSKHRDLTPYLRPLRLLRAMRVREASRTFRRPTSRRRRALALESAVRPTVQA